MAIRPRLFAASVVFGLMVTASACRRPVGEANRSRDPTMDATGGGSPSDGLGIPVVGPVLAPGDPGPTDVVFEVRADSEARAISPLIYGVNGAPEVAQTRWTLLRGGGNRFTAFNWETNASNAGLDYMFQNDGHLAVSNEPGKVVLDMVDAAAPLSAATVVTLPNVDHVAADKLGGGDVRNSGANYLATRFKRNYPKKNGAFAALPDPNDEAVYQDEFVAFLKARRPNARLIFSMDNEPDLWSSTHAEIVTTPITYADLWRRNHAFAGAVKAVWPEAEVLGFVSYGYSGYVSLQNASDSGGRNFIEWYLDQARAAERNDGRRVIDYLDLHWYPEAQGGGQRVIVDSSAPEVVQARVQAPRSLWDPTYEEQSWVRDAAGGPIELLPWLQTKIDAHYPGTKLAFTEWNFGGGNHISGAIAVADVLGIFGRMGVSLAAYWELIGDERFAYAGFRAYRNFDGNGGSFGDISIFARTSDVAAATIYASIDRRDTARTVIVAINKGVARRAGLKVWQASNYKTARVFLLSGPRPAIMEGPSLKAVATNAFVYDMPPESVSILVPAL